MSLVVLVDERGDLRIRSESLRRDAIRRAERSLAGGVASAIGLRIANSIYGYCVRPVILLLFLHITCPERRFRLPALSMQPLVENAIRHGVRAREEGRVHISAEKVAGGHSVSIVDNGLGFDLGSIAVTEGTHIGIKSVRERVERLCGGAATIESVPGRGTTATIFIPDAAGGASAKRVGSSFSG